MMFWLLSLFNSGHFVTEQDVKEWQKAEVKFQMCIYKWTRILLLGRTVVLAQVHFRDWRTYSMQHAKNNFTDMTICLLLHFSENQIQLKIKLDSLKNCERIKLQFFRIIGLISQWFQTPTLAQISSLIHIIMWIDNIIFCDKYIIMTKWHQIQNIKFFFNLSTFIFWKIGNTGEFHFKSANVAL